MKLVTAITSRFASTISVMRSAGRDSGNDRQQVRVSAASVAIPSFIAAPSTWSTFFPKPRSKSPCAMISWSMASRPSSRLQDRRGRRQGFVTELHRVWRVRTRDQRQRAIPATLARLADEIHQRSTQHHQLSTTAPASRPQAQQHGIAAAVNRLVTRRRTARRRCVNLVDRACRTGEHSA